MFNPGKPREVYGARSSGRKVCLKSPGRKVDNRGVSIVPQQFDLLQQLLDATAVRHRVVAQNVANAQTPGYRRLEVDFEEEFSKQLQGRGGFQAASQLEPTVRESDTPSSRPDGNNVDIDKEMGLLSKNALLYQTYAQVIASKLAMMRSAITGN